MNRKIDDVQNDKNRIEGIMKTFQNNCTGKIIENQEINVQIDDLKEQRKEALVNLDGAMLKVDALDKNKNELIRKIQAL